jgi:DNA adenine methylase
MSQLPATIAPPVDAAEPFLKWAGGKRLLLPLIKPHLPRLSADSKYFEPFLGGGALFFSLRPETARLSDINHELIRTYRTLRDHLDDVIEVLLELRNTKDDFYRIRAWRPRTSVRRAARFIYLNKTCFNGLYRENLAGVFNVPYGAHRYNTQVCDIPQLEDASAALRSVELRTADFVQSVSSARTGDFVYFDPPYITGHQNNGFVEYNAKVFSWKDQHRLYNVACRLVDRGVTVLVSNGDHRSIRELYGGASAFTIHTLTRRSTMAGSAASRALRTELLIVGEGARTLA